jgi:hypothetical protein
LPNLAESCRIMPNLVAPINLPFQEWANHIRHDLTQMNIPIADGNKNWRQWARQILLTNPSIPGLPIPSEINYPNDEDWRQWAKYFYQIIQSLP